MRLTRSGPSRQEKPGLQLADGSRIDASAFGEDWGERFLDTDGLRRLAAWANPP